MLTLDLPIQQMLSHALHQLSGLSVSLLDIKGVILFWNIGAKALEGYEAGEVIGKPLDILHPPLEQKEELSRYLLECADREGEVKNIGRRLKKDGTIYIASVLLNRIVDKAGNHLGYIRIARELKYHEKD